MKGVVAGICLLSSIAYSLTKADIFTLVDVLISLAAGVAAGVYLMRYFGVDDDPVGRTLVFWPALWLVGTLVFIVVGLVLSYLTGGFKQPQ